MNSITYNEHLKLLLVIAKEFTKLPQFDTKNPIYQVLANSISYFCRFYAPDTPKIQEIFSHINLSSELSISPQDYFSSDIETLAYYLKLLKNQDLIKSLPPKEYHFVFETSQNELLPYRIFFPSNYKFNQSKLPIVIGLHGAGYDENTFIKVFEKNGSNSLFEQAEKHHFITASLYVGSRLPFYQKQAYNEQNVCDFLEHLKTTFQVDDANIFMIGHSMGCRGTWNLAVNYPTNFKGIAFVAGASNTSQISKYNKFKIPFYYAYGLKDKIVKPHIAESFVEGLHEKTQALIVKKYSDATHESILPFSVPDIFDFFAKID